MSIWLVSWVVVNLLWVPCPPPERIPDVYGREPSIQDTPSIACFEQQTKTKFKRFDSQVDAEKFKADGMAQCAECADWQVIEVPDAAENPWEHFPELPNEDFVIEEW